MKYTIVNRNDELSTEKANYINDRLKAAGMERDDESPKLMIVVGGDGTFLVGIHKYLDQISDILMVGIHTGTLGFFADFQLDEIDFLIECILNKEPEVSTKRLLEVNIKNQDGTKNQYHALNEVRVENILKTQILEVCINDVYLETFRGTGLCISTQPGSTGYNRSLKAAVISDELELLQMAEITGIHHRLFQSLQVPLILHADTQINLQSPSFTKAILCYDHLSVPISDASEVCTVLSKDKKVNFARYHEKLTYTHRIRSLF